MEISKQERAILQKIVTESSFEVMSRVANTLLVQWNQKSLVGENEFETLKNAIGRDERKAALTTFLKTIEELAYDK